MKKLVWEAVVGNNIRQLREEQKLTRAELAERSQVDARYLGSIERGEGNPTVEILGRLARVLNVHPSAFFE